MPLDSTNPFADSIDPFADPEDPFADHKDSIENPTACVDDLPDTSTMSFYYATDATWDYDNLRQTGQLLHKRMTDSTIPCPTPRSTLTIKDLKAQGWDVIHRKASLPKAHREKALAFGYSGGEKDYRMILLEKPVGRTDEDFWHGRIGLGVIFIENIERTPVDFTGPWMSEITSAVYAQKFPMVSLRHVFVANVVNSETSSLLGYLYNTRKPNMTDTGEPVAWDESDGDFEALLGTRIGKVVAYMVLGAFDRGTRRIARIVTWQSKHCIQMRFDLE